jgi:putative PIN family toxin of toxin-antitoxin system
MKVVIDTNVLVSGLLSAYSSSGEIVRMLAAGSIELLYDARIVSEYEDVLKRPKFSFDKDRAEDIIDYIRNFGVPVSAAPLARRLHHADDEPFLEVAISGKAECLITGNIAHFPGKQGSPMTVLTPRQFINRYF